MSNGMFLEPTAEQRRRDGRLAWIIVGICASITLMIVVLGAGLAVRQANRMAADQWRTMRDRTEARQKAINLDAATSDEADEPLPVVEGPPPPNTARALGNPANWVGADDYPSQAVRNEWAGRVRVTITVDPAGSPTGCAVRETSGHRSLDDATCAAMLENARFRPGRSRDVRVRHWTSPVIRWQLPE